MYVFWSLWVKKWSYFNIMGYSLLGLVWTIGAKILYVSITWISYYMYIYIRLILNDWWVCPIVLFVFSDGERNGLWWLALVVLYRMLPMFTLYETFNVWATVPAIVYLPRMFPPKDFLSEKTKIGLVSMDLIYVIFTCYTQDNQQGCNRLSNWFSLHSCIEILYKI